MKKIEKTLLLTAMFTTVITFLFFIVAKICDIDAVLFLSDFAICFAIGFVLAVSTYIFKIKELQVWFKVLIHFFALTPFFFIFVYVSVPEFMKKSGAIFVSVVIYVALYIVSLASAYGIKKLVKTMDKKIDASVAKNDKKSAVSTGFKTKSKKENPPKNNGDSYEELYK